MKNVAEVNLKYANEKTGQTIKLDYYIEYRDNRKEVKTTRLTVTKLDTKGGIIDVKTSNVPKYKLASNLWKQYISLNTRGYINQRESFSYIQFFTMMNLVYTQIMDQGFSPESSLVNISKIKDTRKASVFTRKVYFEINGSDNFQLISIQAPNGCSCELFKQFEKGGHYLSMTEIYNKTSEVKSTVVSDDDYYKRFNKRLSTQLLNGMIKTIITEDLGLSYVAVRAICSSGNPFNN